MRVDQILNYNWKFLVPLSLILVFLVAIVDKLIPEGANPAGRMAIHLALNLLIAFVTTPTARTVCVIAPDFAGSPLIEIGTSPAPKT